LKSWWTSRATGAAVIFLLTVVVYWPALQGGFIWDDESLVIQNPMIRAGNGLYRLWCTTEPVDYWPLTSSIWWLEWRLWGSDPFGYHALNVLVHATNAVLIWMVLRRLAVPGAWLAAVIFAIHPVNVATTAWISELKNILSMLFFASSILLYLKFDRENQWRWYGLSLAFFLLALLSKAAVVALPVVLLLCLWWVHGRSRWRDWLASAPFFLSSLILGLVTVWFQFHRAMQGHLTRTEGFLSRLATAGCVPWFYIGKALLPFPLTVIYPRWHVSHWQWFTFLPAAALIAGLAVLWWKRATWWGRAGFFGMAYFIAMLFPVMGFFQQGFFDYSLVADHWQYYSIVGVIALAVAGGVTICRRVKNGQLRGEVAASAIVIVLGAMTFQRCQVYASDETLWQDNFAKNPRSWFVCTRVGENEAAAGKFEAAIPYYQRALRLDPSNTDTYVSLGVALQHLGRMEEAAQQYTEALRLKPGLPQARNDLGVVLAQQGRLEAAIEQFTLTVRIRPEYAEAHYNMAMTLMQEGRTNEAVPHLEAAIRIDPGYAEAHYGLGIALERRGQTEKAIAEYERALSLQPDLAGVKDALARLHPG